MCGKFLGTPKAWINGISFSHIYGGGPYYEFNEWIPPWMWKEGVSFSVLHEYLRITAYVVIL